MNSVDLPQQGGLLSTFASLFANFSENRARGTEYRRIVAELNAMTKRDLDDIGISRLSIRDIARKAVYGA
jgi:uncharacterized protein YjiS (DUF1127 family)